MTDYHDDALFLKIRDNPVADLQDDARKFPEPELKLLVDLIKKMMAWRAEDRITVENALKHDFFR